MIKTSEKCVLGSTEFMPMNLMDEVWMEQSSPQTAPILPYLTTIGVGEVWEVKEDKHRVSKGDGVPIHANPKQGTVRPQGCGGVSDFIVQAGY